MEDSSRITGKPECAGINQHVVGDERADNPDDEALTLRALKKNNIKNEVVVARDGVEALDFLFGTGIHAERDLSIMPQVILLDLKLPKVSGLVVLRRLRANERASFPWLF